MYIKKIIDTATLQDVLRDIENISIDILKYLENEVSIDIDRDVYDENKIEMLRESKGLVLNCEYLKDLGEKLWVEYLLSD